VVQVWRERNIFRPEIQAEIEQRIEGERAHDPGFVRGTISDAKKLSTGKERVLRKAASAAASSSEAASLGVEEKVPMCPSSLFHS
jgi:dsRNA-specific ribonuclease